jgi:hypothetical protein
MNAVPRSVPMRRGAPGRRLGHRRNRSSTERRKPMTTTTTTIDCVVTTPPPYPVTFDGGQATNGSCAAVQAQFPGDTVTPTTITSVGTTSTAPTTTPTTAIGNPLIPTTCYVGCTPTTTPPGYAGVSGGGLNCGAGPHPVGVTCTPTTTVPVPAASTPVAVPLAFTGADLNMMGGLGLAAVVVGVLLWRASRISCA